MSQRKPTKLFYLPEIYDNRPGSQTIHAFNRSLHRAGLQPLRHQPSQRWTNIGRHLDDHGAIRNFFQFPGKAFIVALMWPKIARLFPVGYYREIIPLCFDCWPDDYSRWEQLFRTNNVKTAFFTARQSCRYFQHTIPGMKSFWLAEACDPDEYPFPQRLVDRPIDVLELGRRHEPYHRSITPPLSAAGSHHLYLKDSQRRMFPTRQELMQVWENTKISICFPKSTTSHDRSGGVETVTFRYFESIASRCLIVGHCPSELEEIFGYNPVIEVDHADSAQQLLDILNTINDYQGLVDRNYQRVREVGSWDARVETMLDTLISAGYGRG